MYKRQEGTMQSLIDATNGEIYDLEVTGPLGNKINANFGILGDGEVGVLETVSYTHLDVYKRQMMNQLT